jgi:hypothetical protein
MTIVADSKTRSGRATLCIAARRGGDNPIISPARAAPAELGCAVLRDFVRETCRAKALRAIRQRSRS